MTTSDQELTRKGGYVWGGFVALGGRSYFDEAEKRYDVLHSHASEN